MHLSGWLWTRTKAANTLVKPSCRACYVTPRPRTTRSRASAAMMRCEVNNFVKSVSWLDLSSREFKSTEQKINLRQEAAAISLGQTVIHKSGHWAGDRHNERIVRSPVWANFKTWKTIGRLKKNKKQIYVDILVSCRSSSRWRVQESEAILFNNCGMGSW